MELILLHAKSVLIELFRIAKLPMRALFRRKLINTGKVPIPVLFYHRVSDEFPNDWTISEVDFARHFQWMKRNFEFISLAETQRRIKNNFNDRPAVSITFDDGYADNCQWALPMLIEQKVPVTYFVTLDFIMTGKPFPHDVEAGRPLRPNTIESIRSLAAAGVEIGAHTRTHPNLGKLDDRTKMYDEVIKATQELESLLDTKIRYFAFPFGQKEHLSKSAAEMLKAAGMQGVCSTLKGWNQVGQDHFHIQRLHGDPSLSRLKNWLSFDPSIIRQQKMALEQLPENENTTAVKPFPITNSTTPIVDDTVSI